MKAYLVNQNILLKCYRNWISKGSTWCGEPILRHERFRNKILTENITVTCFSLYFLSPFDTEKGFEKFYCVMFLNKEVCAMSLSSISTWHWSNISKLRSKRNSNNNSRWC